MKMRVLKLYAAVSADTDNAAYVVLPNPGRIVAVSWHSEITSALAVSSAKLELSFSGVRQTTTNDATGPISMHNCGTTVLTSGGAEAGSNSMLTGISIPVNSGDRLFVNAEITGTITLNFNCFIYVAE